MAQKDRKVQKKRGSRTHGWGNAQKHRGAGSRGGRGMAGSKTHKWIKTLKTYKNYLGRSGFVRHKSLRNEVESINVGDLDERIEKLVRDGKVQEKNTVYSIDLSVMGVGKLLGSGRASHKLKVTVGSATKRALEKIESAGGAVESLQPMEEEFSEEGSTKSSKGAENPTGEDGGLKADEPGVSEAGT